MDLLWRTISGMGDKGKYVYLSLGCPQRATWDGLSPEWHVCLLSSINQHVKGGSMSPNEKAR